METAFKADLDLLIYPNVTRGFIEPANSTFIAKALGLNCRNFQVVDACNGWVPDREVSGLSGLMAEHGGFAPNGWSAVVGAFITIMFSFICTEAVNIAAAESNNPAQNITKATRSVIWRIGVFYLLSIFVVISVVPWNDPLPASVGSYQRALEIMNIPNARFMVDVVVLIAVASCMNSSIYIASHMLNSPGRRGDAPKLPPPLAWRWQSPLSA